MVIILLLEYTTESMIRVDIILVDLGKNYNYPPV